jgi:hypothetical protein
MAYGDIVGSLQPFVRLGPPSQSIPGRLDMVFGLSPFHTRQPQLVCCPKPA